MSDLGSVTDSGFGSGTPVSGQLSTPMEDPSVPVPRGVVGTRLSVVGEVPSPVVDPLRTVRSRTRRVPPTGQTVVIPIPCHRVHSLVASPETPDPSPETQGSLVLPTVPIDLGSPARSPQETSSSCHLRRIHSGSPTTTQTPPGETDDSSRVPRPTLFDGQGVGPPLLLPTPLLLDQILYDLHYRRPVDSSSRFR